MRKTASILLSIYIILQSAYFIAGTEENVFWNCLYFFNQNFIICSVLWMLRGFFNDILISIAISLNIVEMLYNTVYLINIDIAEKINDSHYIAVFIVMTIVFVLILKLSENDSTGKKGMATSNY